MSYSDNIIPVMTGYTTPSGAASSSWDPFIGNEAWRAFDHETGADGSALGYLPYFVCYQFPEAHIVTKYAITYAPEPSTTGYGPQQWVFEGSNDGSNWSSLDSQESAYAWSLDDRREFEIDNTTAYLYYRLYVGLGESSAVWITELEMMEELYFGEAPTIDGDYSVKRFLSSGAFHTPLGVTEAEICLVAGGGAGGTWCGGGGGAGGVLQATGVAVSGVMGVVVGEGGVAPTDNGDGENGEDSIFASLTAIGGGGGGSYSGVLSGNGADGGSGGGVGWHPDGTPGAGTIGQGYAGGGSSSSNTGGGGGGAGAAGADALGGVGGAGGDGVDFHGTVYGGGGGGFSNGPTSAPAGGAGGGGAGSWGTSGAPNGTAGEVNTGCGGGAGWHTSYGSLGGAGGSGVLVIRYLTPNVGQITLGVVGVVGVGETVGVITGTGWVELSPVTYSADGGYGENIGIPVGSGPNDIWLPVVKLQGTGAVRLYSKGHYTGRGHVTLKSDSLFGIAHQLDPGGYEPPPDTPPVPVPSWPPEPLVPTISSSAHTLIGNISISIGGVNYTPYAENLQWDSGVAGGYGACSMKLRPPTPVPNYGDAILITGPGGEYYQGTVVNTPGITFTGENISYEVTGEGPSRQYGLASDFAWTSNNADTSAWQQVDCQNWDKTPGFTISTSNNGLGFQSSDIDDGTLNHDWTTSPTTYYPSKWASDVTLDPISHTETGGEPEPPANWYSNTIPGNNPQNGSYKNDAGPATIRWSAHYFWLGNGLTNQTITGLKAKASYNLSTPTIDAMTTPVFDVTGDSSGATPNADTSIEGYPHGTYDYVDPQWSAYVDSTTPRTAAVKPWYPTYPLTGYWDLYKKWVPDLFPEGQSSPGSMWAGIYGCDRPQDLKVANFDFMMDDENPYLLYKFKPKTSTVQGQYKKWDNQNKVFVPYAPKVPPVYDPAAPGWAAFKAYTAYQEAAYYYNDMGDLGYEVEPGFEVIDIECGCKMLVFYASYVVTPMPVWLYHDFDPKTSVAYKIPIDPDATPAEMRYFSLPVGVLPSADDLSAGAEIFHPLPPQRCDWYASNEVFTEGKQYVQLNDVNVLANEATGDTSADAIAALEAASGGGGEIGNFSMSATGSVSIDIKPYTTRLAAIQQIAGMTAETVYWGWDPDFFFVTKRGNISLDGSIPGVTVNVGIKNDGTITSTTVVYSDNAATNASTGPEDRRVLAAWVPKSMTFDVNGDAIVEPNEFSGLLDGSYLLHSSAAAAAAAQSYIAERGVFPGQDVGDPAIPQWEGTITLKGMAGYAATKVATLVSVGDVQDAVITGISVDVDSDTITLSIGGTGYAGRFPTVSGSPNSAVPSNASAGRTLLPYMTKFR